MKNLKDVWKRIKLTAKAEYHVVDKPKAAGGPPPPPQPSAISAIIKQICPQEFIQMRNTNTYRTVCYKSVLKLRPALCIRNLEFYDKGAVIDTTIVPSMESAGLRLRE